MVKIKNYPIAHERVRELVSYDPETGIFRYKMDRRHGVKAGDIAGNAANAGHLKVKVDNNHVLAHRLAWFYVHGEWPPQEIDHINRNPSDNRLCNLRLADRSLNNFNKTCTAKSGFKGVYRQTKKGGGFMAIISVRGDRRYLGTFPTAVEAHQAYLNAAEEGYGGYKS
jgi:hypothetical protein